MSRAVRILVGLFALWALLVPSRVSSAGPSGTWQVLAAAAGGATFYHPSGLAVAPGGELYVADVGNSRVVEISPAARLLRQWHVPALEAFAAAGNFESHVALASDASDNVYLGSDRWHRVYRVAPSGRQDVFGPSFGSTVGVAVGPRGNVFVADGGAGHVVKLDPGGHVLSVWRVPSPEKGTTGTLEAVAVGAGGMVYVSMSLFVPADESNCEMYCWGGTMYHWIQKLSDTGKVTGTWGWDGCDEGVMSSYHCDFPASIAVTSRGLLVAGHADEGVLNESTGDSIMGKFGWISGLAADAHGDIYLSDAAKGTITRFSPQGRILGELGGGSALGHFQCPEAVAADSAGSIFVDDVENGRVVKLSPGGQAVTSWAVPGPIVGEINYGCQFPHSIAVDSAGHVYLADPSGGAVRVYSGEGQSLDVRAVGPGPAPTHISAVAVTPAGDLVVAGYDTAGDWVEKLAPDGTVLATARVDVGSTGGWIDGLAVDRAANVYLSANFAGTIFKLLPDLSVETRWSGFADPAGLAIGAQGNLLVADTGVYQGSQSQLGQGVFELSPAGKLLARWDGVGSNPGQFHAPSDIAVDAQGNLIVADTGNNRVQRLAQ